MLLLVSLALFLLLFPAANAIDFFQNDDWVYYATVDNFLKGNFTLHPYSGPTLYLQAFAGAIFASAFSMAKLPLLTLFVSVANFYIFVHTLMNRLKVEALSSYLLGVIFFFNPLSLYLTWGFMTGNYFVFFLLLSFHFYFKYEETNNRRYFSLVLITAFLGLLVRQVALVIPAALAVYLFLRQEYRRSVISLLTFVFMYAFYSYMLPLTARIREVPLQFHHFLKFDYTFSLVLGMLIVLAGLLLPVFINAINLKDLLADKKKLALLIILGTGIYATANYIYYPEAISWGEFPYFENTFERKGFYPRGIEGTKYHFVGIYDLYKYWDIAARVLTGFFLSYMLVFLRKKTINFFSIFIAVYIILMVLTHTFYDRYIVILIPATVYFLVSLKEDIKLYGKVLLTLFAIFVVFLGYQFSMDFILTNKYVWERSEQLVENNNVPREGITANNAWNLEFGRRSDILYRFSFDKPGLNESIDCCYELIEEKEIEYPFNFFVEPRIHLYKKK